MKTKNILILDSSSKGKIIILSKNNQIKTLKQPLISKDYVASIISLIDTVLKENNITLKDLDFIIVGVGPGSYTGTRVSVLTAKMLAWTLQIPLYQISSLILLTSGYSSQFLTPLIDARNNSFFALSLNLKQICLKEGRYDSSFLQSFKNHILISLESIKISLDNIYLFMTQVLNPHLLVPNYLVKTQAERQLKDQKIIKDNIK
ncbi:tRNA (adenosine(37)-N6)-threonylcarbamoyltransferase complex dimerization subunit type 1 TsaB ['Fragaria x ananassa' phyllody phytoplasma]|uniref:tRNA (Adenosine(37)-N6)-threonylcarbamoyltransferase complex dimerization subunit type 1 TsaB n=1 Tax='Fragaria x ananassa' phyllody phytoplasma TaxID=2358428 RepID=A0ABS5K2U3_9MOLU|nr:tRNA (adenosine(37)-N6)-threonylcarbamoyltransferase complex dimerization subunit type 1 TsaB ['Fragaria x ananassa' phyllody phytoplasma]MBS2126168.1 tRNA (adenosine(37)-N6)-threonylcarbamoyltransferase complex dimerization subunit type 1 TsaB ['Fragaria x ananassa' phyllody phytoplasma]